MFKQKLKNLWSVLAKAFYPRFSCYACGREMEEPEKHVCKRCNENMFRLDGNLCLRCGEPIPEPSKFCNKCRKDEDICYNAARSCFEYNELSANVVAGLKYKGRKYVVPFMAKEMVKAMEAFGDVPDIIIPAPISDKRRHKRGFNQTELLAEEINDLIGKASEIRTDIIVREKEIKPQVGLKCDDRLSNLDKAFKLAKRPSLVGKVVLIVDDVMTTGTTINEISRKIKKLKPKAIYALTFAKTLSPDTKKREELTK